MSTVLIVGDGPAGLSAALFLAKRGMQVVVFGQDQTPMHHAQLFNYLGIPEIRGSRFQAIAREQVAGYGADLRDEAVTSIEVTGDGFLIGTDRGTTAGDYLVLAGGKPAQRLARDLGVPTRDGRVVVDGEHRTEEHHRAAGLQRDAPRDVGEPEVVHGALRRVILP
jgi:thioredoxin reductase